MNAITGIGVLSAAGCGARVATDAAERSSPCYGWLTQFEPPEGGPCVAAEVPPYDVNGIVGSTKSYLDPSARHFLAACALALRDARLPIDGSPRDDVGVGYGSAFGPLESIRGFQDRLVEKGARLANPVLFGHTYINTAPSLAAIEWGLRGPNLTVCAGAASGLAALAAAAEALGQPGARGMLVGASDALSEWTCRALGDAGLATDAADPEAVAGADGAVPGEAGVALMVEPLDVARARSAPVRGVIRAVGVEAGGEGYRALEQVLKVCIRALESQPDLYVSPANGDSLAEEREARALAACGLDMAPLRRISPARVLGETFGAAGMLYVAIAATMLAPGQSALVATMDRNWAGAAVVTGGEVARD